MTGIQNQSVRVEIADADVSDKATIANLMQLYLHDLSDLCDDQLMPNGLFELDEYFDLYWDDPARAPLLIRADGDLAGFCLVREMEAGVFAIAEFFVTRRWRRRGVGQQAATLAFGTRTGHWTVATEAGNLDAQRFWDRVIADHTGGQYQRGTSDAQPSGPSFHFSSYSL